MSAQDFMVLARWLFGIVATAAASTASAALSTASALAAGVACASLVGCYASIGREILLAVLLTVADPYLDTESADFGACYCKCIVDVCTEGVERSTSLLEHFGASHLGAAYTAADLNLDTLGTHSHSGSDGHLDGTAVRHAALDLTGDAVCYDVGVNFGSLDFEDVDLNILLGDFLELFLELVNLLATFADDYTRTGGVDGDGDEFEGTLDDDPGKAGL